MINERINKLRKLMTENNLSAYLINDSDPHISEYVPEYFKTRKWITGFDGSAGTVVITDSKVGLWVDSRYYIQAAKQIDGTEIELFKMGIPHVPTYTKWLEDNLKKNDSIAFDGKVFSTKSVNNLVKNFEDKEIKVISKFDLVSELWNKDRPELSTKPILALDLKYTGKTRVEKIKDVRKEMEKQNIDYHLVCSLDNVSWLFNIRGKDILFNPVVISYALISKNETYLFIDEKKLSDTIKDDFAKDSITILDYNSISNFLNDFSSKGTILIDETATNKVIYDSIHPNLKKIAGDTISNIMKSKKNET